MQRSTTAAVFAIALALSGFACGEKRPDETARPSSAGSPLTPSALAGRQTEPGGFAFGPAGSSIPGFDGPNNVDFPPRNEPFDFRAMTLETLYRDVLRRGANSSFVDVEGTIVWTQEYLRYRVNRCGHSDAVQRVFAQIDGQGIQPVCGTAPGGPVQFPPRDEPFDFRNQLEVKYRDQLRRQAVQTFVDVEGDIVWTQEYLRYRVSGCSHADATSRVVDQINGRGIQPDCAVVAPPPPPPPTRPVARISVNGPSGQNRCLSPGSGPADCTFDASNSTSSSPIVRYEWSFSTPTSSGTGTGRTFRPTIGCGFSTGVQTFQIRVDLTVIDENGQRDSANNPNVQGIRPPANCGFNP